MSRVGRYVGMGCGTFVLIAIATTFVACYAVVPMPARDAAQGFLADVRGRNYPSALQRTSAAYQNAHDARRLQESIARVPRLDRHTGATFWNASFDDDRATLDGVLAGDDGETPIGVELVHADGYWYVDQVVVQGAPLE